VRDNLRTLYAATEQGFCAPLPAFVKDELEGYIDCGVLARGFAVLGCPECSERIVVGFSCKSLGFCPSCLGRRMASTAANLVEHVLPSEASLRQFVLTLPFELRARLAYDGKLLGDVCQAFVDSVLGWYRRHFHGRGIDGGKSGAVTAGQRVSSDLRLNPHFHTLALDGVYSQDEHGQLTFHPLPCLSNGDVADILQIAQTRVLRLLRRQGVIEDDTVNADDTLTDQEPALAELAVASTLGSVPAGPTLRQKDLIRLRTGRDLEHPRGSAPPRTASRCMPRRARIIPPPKPPADSDDTNADCSTCPAKDKPPNHRSGYRPWRELLMRSFKIDIQRCQSCGGRMKLRALLMTTASIERYLRCLGEPVDPPTLAPARDPPYFKSRVIRRRLGEPAQADLFDAH
jgi:hypothetical protein